MREDSKALELLKNAPKSASEEERIKVYADIAAKLGFDLSAEDIGKHLKVEENCWFNDGCDWYFIGYDNYICHYTYYDECHIPSAGFVIAD